MNQYTSAYRLNLQNDTLKEKFFSLPALLAKFRTSPITGCKSSALAFDNAFISGQASNSLGVFCFYTFLKVVV